MLILKEKRVMIEKVHIPPIKIQGIKTKIVPLIAELERCEEEKELGMNLLWDLEW